MTHPFAVREEITLDATPEQVWAAIATGPGVNSWLMGRNEFEPRDGGRGSMEMFGSISGSTITAWEPGKHFAYRGDTGEDGTFMAFEYLIEARDGGGTVLRFVHNGMLGDDWEAEYDGMSVGDRAYLRKLAVYLKHFAPATSTYDLFVPGPRNDDKAAVWAGLTAALGIDGPATDGAKARLCVDGLPASEGFVEFTHEPSFVGMRTEDAMIMLIHGYDGTVFASGHSFADTADHEAESAAWQAWLRTTFG